MAGNDVSETGDVNRRDVQIEECIAQCHRSSHRWGNIALPYQLLCYLLLPIYLLFVLFYFLLLLLPCSLLDFFNLLTGRHPSYEAVRDQMHCLFTLSNWYWFSPVRSRLRSYTPIRPGYGEIRLLKLNPGREKQPLTGELATVRLSDKQKFAALTYCWEPLRTYGPFCDTIRINNERVHITRALGQLLRKLRQQEAAQFLWIDEVCVNHDQKGEKSAKLQVVNEIFRSAEQVIAYLEMPQAYKNRFDRERIGKLNSKLPDLEHGLIANEPGKHEWWKRAWAVPELLAARKIGVYIGEKNGSCKVYQSFEWDRLIRKQEHNSPLRLLSTYITKWEMLAADPIFGIFSLIHEAGFQEDRDAREKVFAYHALLKDPKHSALSNMNYLCDDTELWTALTKNGIKVNKSFVPFALLDTLQPKTYSSRIRATLNKNLGCCSQSASWALDLNRYPDRDKRPRLPLWTCGLEYNKYYSPKVTYRAAGNAPGYCRIYIGNGDIIAFHGFVHSTVAHVFSFPDQPGPYPGPYGVNFHSAKKACLDLMSADRYFDGDRNFSAEIHRALTAGHCYEGDAARKRLDTAICRGRKLLLTKGGQVGLGHDAARIGDIICVLLGFDVPVILRREHIGPFYQRVFCRKQTHLDCCVPELYSMVGLAYVNGIMSYEGDIEQDIETGMLAIREFFVI